MTLMDMDRGGEDMTVEEAKEHLKRKLEHSGELPIVVEYPWWVTLRLPLTLLGAAFALIAIALISLVYLVVRDTNAADETREVRICRDLFTSVITAKAAETRGALASSQQAFNQGLVFAVDDDDSTNVDVGALQEATALIPVAVRAEAEAVAARDDWDAAGQPMPCPLPQE